MSFNEEGYDEDLKLLRKYHKLLNIVNTVECAVLYKIGINEENEEGKNFYKKDAETQTNDHSLLLKPRTTSLSLRVKSLIIPPSQVIELETKLSNVNKQEINEIRHKMMRTTFSSSRNIIDKSILGETPVVKKKICEEVVKKEIPIVNPNNNQNKGTLKNALLEAIRNAKSISLKKINRDSIKYEEKKHYIGGGIQDTLKMAIARHRNALYEDDDYNDEFTDEKESWSD